MLSKMHHGVNKEKQKLLDKYLVHEKVLDIGCGNGLYSLALHDMGYDVVLVDIIDRRDEAAKKLQFINSDALEYTPNGTQYDNVIAFDLIEHIDDKLFLQNCLNLLNEGGRLFLSVPNIDNSLLEKVQLAHIHYTDKTHLREYSPENLKELANKIGYKIVEIRAHYNTLIVNTPQLMSTDSIISKHITTMISLILKVLRKIGLLKDKVIADWFCVLEKY